MLRDDELACLEKSTRCKYPKCNHLDILHDAEWGHCFVCEKDCSMDYVLNDYTCPKDGEFESLEEREADRSAPAVVKCPKCGEPSPKIMPAPMGHVMLSSFTRGPIPSEREARERGVMDTREIARRGGVDI